MAKISAAESQVMEAVWRAGPRTADEIVAEVGQPQGWGDATVKTLINRLLKKKALISERSDGRTPPHQTLGQVNRRAPKVWRIAHLPARCIPCGLVASAIHGGGQAAKAIASR